MQRKRKTGTRRARPTIHSRRLSDGLLAVLLATILAGCAGGSGSSGFDIAAGLENQLIDQALQEATCVAADQTTICPTDQATGATPGQPAGAPEADSSLGGGFSVPCGPADSANTCAVSIAFAPRGLPGDAAYHVAWREGTEPGAWTILPPADVTTSPGPLIDAVARIPGATTEVQLALLAFFDAPAEVPPGPVETLASTGADVLFVTPPVAVVP